MVPSISSSSTRLIRTISAIEPSHRCASFDLRSSRLTQIDYDREMAFVAISKREPARFETLGVVRAVADPDNVSAEFAVIEKWSRNLGLVFK